MSSAPGLPSGDLWLHEINHGGFLTALRTWSQLAVVAALAPVCADKFRALPDFEAKKVALSKVDSWKRRDEFPTELVTLPGESYPSSALVDACSTLLLAPKSASLK
jgi:hypothetical protein